MTSNVNETSPWSSKHINWHISYNYISTICLYIKIKAIVWATVTLTVGTHREDAKFQDKYAAGVKLTTEGLEKSFGEKAHRVIVCDIKAQTIYIVAENATFRITKKEQVTYIWAGKDHRLKIKVNPQTQVIKPRVRKNVS